MRDNKTFKIVILSVMFALMIAFLFFMPLYAFVPLIILAVFAQLSNVKMAALMGLLFGIASLLSALLVPSSPLYVAFLNPLVSVVPRVLVGIAGYYVYVGVYKLLGKKRGLTNPKDIFSSYKGEERKIASKNHYIASVLSSISCALVNTILVVGIILIWYNGRTFTLEDMSILMKPEIFIPLITLNAILEPIITAIVAPPIVTALKHLR
jgi:uncharacterized membrane protein